MDFPALYYVLVSQWGYVGIFLAQLLSSSTVLLPLPGMAAVFLYGAILNPALVGVSAGLGASLGELTGYMIGYGGHKMILRRNKEWSKTTRSLFRKHNPFIVIVAGAALPFPFDVIGVLCGISKYDIKKFFAAVLIGNTIKLTFVAFAGLYGISWVLKLFGNT